MIADNKFISILKAYPLAVLSVIIILICSGVIFLRGDASIELTSLEADMNSRIRMIDQNVKNAKGLQSEVDEVQLLVEQIKARLFDRDQRAVNINFFYAIEDRLQVRISNIGQMPSSDPIYSKGGVRALKLHSTIVYSISLSGTFDELLTFMYELYKVDRLIRVADLQVSTRSRGGSDGELDARLRVIVLAKSD